MNNTHCLKLGTTLAGVLALIVTSAHADTFGSGGNAFTIDFVNIGNLGNVDDVNNPFGNIPRGCRDAFRWGQLQLSDGNLRNFTDTDHEGDGQRAAECYGWCMDWEPTRVEHDVV